MQPPRGQGDEESAAKTIDDYPRYQIGGRFRTCICIGTAQARVARLRGIGRFRRYEFFTVYFGLPDRPSRGSSELLAMSVAYVFPLTLCHQRTESLHLNGLSVS